MSDRLEDCVAKIQRWREKALEELKDLLTEENYEVLIADYYPRIYGVGLEWSHSTGGNDDDNDADDDADVDADQKLIIEVRECTYRETDMAKDVDDDLTATEMRVLDLLRVVYPRVMPDPTRNCENSYFFRIVPQAEFARRLAANAMAAAAAAAVDSNEQRVSTKGGPMLTYDTSLNK